jgi:hypothetical protein
LINNETNSQLIKNTSSKYINRSEENSDKLIIDYDEEKSNLNDDQSEKRPNYSLNTIVQAPLVLNKINDNNHSNKSYADIHLSINIFLPKKRKHNSVC